MTAAAAPPRATPCAPDTLRYAREAIRDPRGHDDITILAACLTIEGYSQNPGERARACDLRTLVEGETAADPDTGDTDP